MRIENGWGGFLSVVPEDGDGYIRFGVGVIRFVVDGNTVHKEPMTKRQDQYTVGEITALLKKFERFRDLRTNHYECGVGG